MKNVTLGDIKREESATVKAREGKREARPQASTFPGK